MGRLKSTYESSRSDNAPRSIEKDGQVLYMIEGKYVPVKQLALQSALLKRCEEVIGEFIGIYSCDNVCADKNHPSGTHSQYKRWLAKDVFTALRAQGAGETEGDKQ